MESPRWLGHVQTWSPRVCTSVNRLAVRLVCEGRLAGGWSASYTSQAPEPGCRSGWVWQASCLRWFRPATRRAAGQPGSRAARQSGEGPARPELQPQRRGAPRGRQVQEQGGGAELGRVPDSQASRSDLPPPRPGLGGVDLRQRNPGARGESGRADGTRSGQPGHGPRAYAGRRATQVQDPAPRKRLVGAGPRAGSRLRGAACALPAVPAGPLRAPASLAAAAPLCRPRARPLGPEAPPLRADDWPSGSLVGGAPCRRRAVYSKGRACALRQLRCSWRSPAWWLRSPFVPPSL